MVVFALRKLFSDGGGSRGRPDAEVDYRTFGPHVSTGQAKVARFLLDRSVTNGLSHDHPFGLSPSRRPFSPTSYRIDPPKGASEAR